MAQSDMNRREFNTLAAAAFGGIVAGTMAGCGKSGSKTDSKTGENNEPKEFAEKHICKGMNTCKGKGRDGKNECAGQGSCYTVAKHECATKNACKGQGGCGGKAGINECKGQGGCGVPMQGDMWKDAKAAFDKRMAARKSSAAKSSAKSS